jgi:hypothetical protein
VPANNSCRSFWAIELAEHGRSTSHLLIRGNRHCGQRATCSSSFSLSSSICAQVPFEYEYEDRSAEDEYDLFERTQRSTSKATQRLALEFVRSGCGGLPLGGDGGKRIARLLGTFP